MSDFDLSKTADRRRFQSAFRDGITATAARQWREAANVLREQPADAMRKESSSRMWAEMGEPDQLTVTIVPGDGLNP